MRGLLREQIFLKLNIVAIQIVFIQFLLYQAVTTQAPLMPSPKHVWDYEVIDYQVVIDDRSLIDSEINITYISRGNYGLSGYLDIKVDMYDNNTAEVFLERSREGFSGQYFKTPFSIPRMPISQMFNTAYKDLMMESLHKCSNAPYFDVFKVPLRKSKLIFTNCHYDTDNLPNIMGEGYYKLHVIVYGPTTVKNIVSFQIMHVD